MLDNTPALPLRLLLSDHSEETQCYDAIRDLLRSSSGIVDIGMDELSDKIPGGLPPSAYTWEAWWNDGDETHIQSKSWAAANYNARPNLARRTVRFIPA